MIFGNGVKKYTSRGLQWRAYGISIFIKYLVHHMPTNLESMNTNIFCMKMLFTFLRRIQDWLLASDEQGNLDRNNFADVLK